MAKEKPDPKPDPAPKPDPEEVKEKVNPATGESEEKEWRANVNRKLDALAETAQKLGKAIQEWGTGPEPKPEPKPTPERDTSDPAENPEPLDDWSH